MERIVTGLLLSIVLFWTGACFWVRGDGIPDWWLPVAFGFGITIATRVRIADESPSPRWARAAAWLVICGAFVMLWHGALSTPSRHWDGAASFDAKVFWLENSPTLQQPFFATEGVFHHSPDYPLLLPMLVAMVERLAPEFGRVVLPFVYMLLIGVVSTALQRRRIAPLLRVAITAAVAVTPSLLTPGGGAVDSGYGECILLLATTTTAAGLLNRHSLWFALGITLMLAAKPEGQAYALLALAVAYARSERSLLMIGTVALTVTAFVWEPVRAALLHREPSFYMTLPVVIAAFATLHLGVVKLAPRLDTGRNRWLLLAAVPFLGLLAVQWLGPMFAEGNGTMAVYMRQADGAFAGLANLPAYFAGVFEFGISRLRLGTTLLIPFAALAVAKHCGIKLHDRSVLIFALLGVTATAVPFVLSPEPDLEHHIRSSLPRLLLHWVGPIWLLSASWLHELLVAADRCEAARTVPGPFSPHSRLRRE